MHYVMHHECMRDEHGCIKGRRTQVNLIDSALKVLSGKDREKSAICRNEMVGSGRCFFRNDFRFL